MKNTPMASLARLITELEKQGDVLSADDKSTQITPDVEEGGNKPVSGIEPGKDAPASKQLEPKDAKEPADLKVKVQEAGNKPLSKEAGEADNVRKDLKPLEADQASSVKVVAEESGNKPVKGGTPGEQPKVEDPAEKKANPDNDLLAQAESILKAANKGVLSNEDKALLEKAAKVLSADDAPTNKPKEITAEGSEAAKLTGDDSRKATEEASAAVGKATADFTMDRSQAKGVDPSTIHAERGSGRAQDMKKFAAWIKIAAWRKKQAVDSDVVRLLTIGGGLGAGLGALRAGKGKRLRGAGVGGLLGTGAGALALGGKRLGEAVGKNVGPVLAARVKDPANARIFESDRIGGLAGGLTGALLGGNLAGNLFRSELPEKDEWETARDRLWEKASKAVSKKQQKFMGMVHAVQKGDMKAPSKEVGEVAGSMKPSSVTDFAETKRKGLPEKKAAGLRIAYKYLMGKRAGVISDAISKVPAQPATPPPPPPPVSIPSGPMMGRGTSNTPPINSPVTAEPVSPPSMSSPGSSASQPPYMTPYVLPRYIPQDGTRRI